MGQHGLHSFWRGSKETQHVERKVLGELRRYGFPDLAVLVDERSVEHVVVRESLNQRRFSNADVPMLIRMQKATA
jgi:hypothetical protein